ncbi:hypothetical protein FDUTEX481_05587 [Tolypothrix sp. PCC 7601]|nr:hypothetical protein FDUTEX481_05587 [Tolypothrix sp. PCC 7601]
MSCVKRSVTCRGRGKGKGKKKPLRDFQIKKYPSIYCGAGKMSAQFIWRASCPPHKME